ncbi:MAG: hypothetical protein OXG64_02930 [Chloroflexi bacterium]|nr:hypothetical protein [Chloroflexota bacterium]MCY3957612.1 hypothetical protein [Chloroflexota bacterium]
MRPEPVSRRALPRGVFVGRLRRRHALPFPGRILVEVGERVVPGQIWCRGRLRSGVVVVDLPRLLQVQPEEVHDLLAVEPGVTVEAETLLAGTPGRLRGSRHWLAPTRGTLSDVNPRTGVAVFVGEERDAALYCRLGGEVVSADPDDGIVVEGEGAAVAGALGGGGRAYGPFRFVESGERPDSRTEGAEPGILVTPDSLRAEWVRRALERRPAGIVAPSADAEMAAGLGLAPTIAGLSPPEGSYGQPPQTIVLIVGVGAARMPHALQDVFRAAEGTSGAVIGARRPGQSEVLLEAGAAAGLAQRAAERLPVHLASGPGAGAEGMMLGDAPDVGRMSSGIATRFVRVRLAEGGVAAWPTPNLATLA